MARETAKASRRDWHLLPVGSPQAARQVGRRSGTVPCDNRESWRWFRCTRIRPPRWR